MNKFLHHPTIRLRAAAGNGASTQLAESLRYLFGLEADTPPPPDTGDGDTTP